MAAQKHRFSAPAQRNPRALDLRWAKALSHPIRADILQCLAEQESTSPTVFAEARRIPVGRANYHFRRLEGFGLIAVVAEVRRRGAIEHFYALGAEMGAEEPAGRVRRALLARPDAHTSARAILDAAAIAELRSRIAALFAQMRRLEADTVRRSAVEGHASAFDVSVVYAIEDAGRSDASP